MLTYTLGAALTTYTVTYDANGGTGAPGQQTKTKGQALTLSSTKPSRAKASAGSYTVTLNPNGGKVSTASLSAARTTSYTFKNWNTLADGTGNTYTPGTSYTYDSDLALYAQWNSSTSTAAVALPTPWRYGYTFKGWGTSSTASSGVTGTYTPSKSLTLYAIWEKEDLSGWSTTKPDNIYEDQIETATQYRYADRTATGGWTKTGSGTIDYVKSWPSGFNTSHSLYSKYNKTPKTAGVSGNKKVEVTSNSVVTYLYWHWCWVSGWLPNDNYNVNVWIRNEEHEGKYHQYFSAFEGSYEEKHTDKYGNYGGEWFYVWRDNPADGSWWWQRLPVYRQTYTEYTGSDASSTWSAWSDWTMTRYATSDTRKEDSRTVYRYKSSVKPFAVTFDPNGGTCGTATRNVTRGETYGTLPTPTRTDCAFDGWYDAKEGGNKVIATTRVTANSVHTLYARWTNFTVAYDANGGSGAPAQQTKARGQALTLSGVKPTRTGAAAGSYTVTLNANGGTVSKASLSAACTTQYTFHKWNTKKDGSGAAYAAGASYTADAPVTLYAQWTSTVTAETVVLPNATLDGSSFDGWFTAMTGGDRVGGPGDDYAPVGSVTLYAHWTKNHAHTVGQPVRENEIAATCTAAGGYDEVTYCTSCGEELTRTHITIAKLGHASGKAVKENETAATCIGEGGYDMVVRCTVCGEVISTEHTAVPATGEHVPGEPVKENEVAASGSAQGSYDEVVYCSVCHEELSRVTKYASKTAKGMTMVTEPKDATIRNKQKATFTVKVSGSKLTYQWYYRKNAEAKWVKLTKETKAKLSVTGSTSNGGYQYYCVIKNGKGTLKSDVVTLTVNLFPPQISQQPKSQTVHVGDKVTFAVSAEGDGLTYQWYYKKSASATKWTKASKATKATYTVTGKIANDGYQYRCLIKNADGKLYTDPVTLDVDYHLPTITAQPTIPKSVKKNTSVTLTVEAENIYDAALTYQWYSRKSSSAKWTKIKKATEPTYTFKATTKLNGYQYKCDVTNVDGTVSTKTLKLKVK